MEMESYVGIIHNDSSIHMSHKTGPGHDQAQQRTKRLY
jgi:hypothetical protein